MIEENAIFLTRGDDAVIEIALGTEDEPYEMQEADVLTLTVREKPSTDYEVLMRIDSNPGSNRIVILAKDTANIPAGRYSADVQLTANDGRIITVWPQLEGSSRYKVKNIKNFIIMPEVTNP